ncbi:pleiotropic regulatory protein RsmS [Vibrio porteresiae]|uniref:Pleiotropic regulatory protein RsmS n=1 Tax=Vibrio porteresiae DSM 19223 TaxID=1123496 RepID=A0ABZ0QC47_9VIBR|nr:pleiotropic regulatory protein RsmS [Vibrio porteresiae]WPC73130.1 pleiotropic regulatory protein RsmS [Vibrio porteresiae DSM 19223]
MSDPIGTPLDQAPDEVKLAVDLIYLLETHAIEPHTALAALEIVKRDLLKRVKNSSNSNADSL